MRLPILPRRLLLLALVVLPLPGGHVQAEDGAQLLFTSVRDGKPNLYLVDAEGGNERQLTREGGSLGAWSPDGKRIVFTSERSGNADLYVMDADGSHVQRLTSTTPDRENQAAWSPDGKKILFHRHTDAPPSDQLFLMDPDGTHEVHLTNEGSFSGDPAWSPDGKQILFVSTRNGDGFHLFVMAADGTGARPLPAPTSEGWVFPAWSPDGKRIAYTSRVGDAQELFVCPVDGANPEKLTSLGGSNTFAAWSPDGKEIAFDHYPNQTDPGELWVISADGSAQRRIGTTGPPLSGRPAWKPK